MLTSKENFIHNFGMRENNLKHYHHGNTFSVDGYQTPIRKDSFEG